MKTLFMIFISFLALNVNAMNMGKLTSMEFSKPCDAKKIINLIPSQEARIIIIMMISYFFGMLLLTLIKNPYLPNF